MNDLNIRSVAENDLPAVLEMIKALAAHHDDTPTVTLESLRRDALGDAPWLILLVAEAQGRLVGYAGLCPLAQLQFGVRGVDMHHLFVAEDQRGTGVGRALIDASLERSKAMGCRYMTVGTHPDNKTAAEVYRAAGFEPLPPPGPRFQIKFEA